LLVVGAFVFGRMLGAADAHPTSGVILVLGLAFFVGLGCLIVGPILWVRGARQSRAEEMALLRQIAAKQQP
jgi:hypothetical protein